MKGPTPKQKDVLRYIAAHVEEYSYPPTQAEIASALECSRNNARSYVLALEKKGLLSRVPGGYRCLSVTPEGASAIRGNSKQHHTGRA